MARLADLLEDYRNLVGRANWSIGRDIDVMSGYDPDLAEFVERSSLGTGAHGLGAGGLAGMIKASHGSPHAFTKFDFSKIGTGEGNQAYGHGLYFGEGFDSPVAKNYSITLANRIPLYKGMKPDSTVLTKEALDAIEEFADNRGDVGRALDMLDATKKPESLQWLRENYKDLSTTPGHLYNVELRWPDAAREAADPLGEHHLLDWFEPLSKQSEHVKKSLRDYATLSGKEHYVPESSDVPVYIDEGISPDTRGKEFYEWLASQPLDIKGLASRELASDTLKAFDVPGIRYLDQASRGTGEGTRNYVMFDDALANIVSRNGVSLSDLLQNPQPELYRGFHSAPGPEFGAQLHDLTGGGTMYPDDIYSANAARFYGHGGRETAAMDKKAVSLIHMLRNKPDELVDVYRAVPKDESIQSINPGDWVTITPDYAKYHGEGPLGGNYKILKQKVPAKSIWTNADSIHEYGYWPD